MNSLKIDFTKSDESKGKMALGVLMILLSIAYLALIIFSMEINWIWILNLIIFLLLGIGNIAAGKGHTISRWFGDAYLLLNEDKFDYKPSNYKPPTVLNWDHISSIKFNPNQIDFIKNDSNAFHIEYSRFSYNQVQDIKSMLTSIAEKHSIKIS